LGTLILVSDRLQAAALEILTALSLLFLAMHSIANVKDLTEVYGTRGAEVHTARTWRLEEIALKGTQWLFALSGWSGEGWCVESSKGRLGGVLDPGVVEELLDGVTLIRVDGEQV
jgi:hypothetical protein